MSNFIDYFGRYHDKPVTEKNPIPSNNGWIYTAYAEKGNLPINYFALASCFKRCKSVNMEMPNGISLHRHPIGSKDTAVPISRDEILGMASLGLLKLKHLNGWNFSPYPIPSFNPIKTIRQFLELIGKHRNYLWENNMSHTYRFAFSVPITDRHFILQKCGKFNVFYWLVAKIDARFSKPKNGIHWVKYGGDERKKIMQSEFPENHPLRSI
jgi:hypothetical protein